MTDTFLDSSKNILVRDPSGIILPNIYPIIGKFTGYFYTIIAQGGFANKQQFPMINLAIKPPLIKIRKFDITNSVQVIFDVDTFNKKLGVFNSIRKTFSNDTIFLSADDFVNGVTVDKIISLGSLSNLYTDFINYVNNYFSYADGFTSLFSFNNDFNYNNGVFDATSFINMISIRQLNTNDIFLPKITGTIKITNVNRLLYEAKKNNVFGNRDNNNTYGFLDGDLIVVPSGITITLSLDLGSLNIPISDVQVFRKNEENTGNNYSSSTNISNIKRDITTPLLLTLRNLQQNQ